MISVCGGQVSGADSPKRNRFKVLTMPYTSSCRVEKCSLLFGKLFNILIFAKVRLALILNIVVKGHDNLRWVMDVCRTDGHEFLVLG
jgi:hypothetical protein